ncbi:MAG: efflux RND transporter periplasmic adaptor subunit [Shewanella sp.]
MNSNANNHSIRPLLGNDTPRPWALSQLALALALIGSLAYPSWGWAGDDHDHDHESPSLLKPADDHDHPAEDKPADEHGETALKLTESQLALAGIRVLPLSSESLAGANLNLNISATASLVVDRDRTVTLAPQLDVRVLARHVVPGQEVKQGEPLLTLGGVAIAQAQADYINAAAEWSRVRRMSEGAVSLSRRMQAQVDAELKRAILEAIKMTSAQIRALELAPEAIGSYQLLSPINGRVQQDIAMLGQVFSAGTPLMQLTDESHLWVEAQLTPMQAKFIEIGSPALVQVGDKTLAGKIIGRSHEINSVTRTEQVLVSMPNPDHALHAGQFAELYFTEGESKGGNTGIVLPDAALSRSGDGDWQIFIQDEDGFESVEVEVVQRQRGLSLVRWPQLEQAQEAQVQVVVSGAFFLASELAKSGFDIHGH